jgi:hypothetical protein
MLVYEALLMLQPLLRAKLWADGGLRLALVGEEAPLQLNCLLAPKVHHQIYLHPYPRELMLRNHV